MDVQYITGGYGNDVLISGHDVGGTYIFVHGDLYGAGA